MLHSSRPSNRYGPPLQGEGVIGALRCLIAGFGLAGLLGIFAPEPSAAQEAFSWTLTAPPAEIGLQQGEALGVGVAVGPVEATNVLVLQSALVETGSHRQLAEGRLTLCADAAETCDGKPITLAKNRPHRLWLKPTSTGWFDVGKFSGTVTIAAAQKPAGESLTTTVYISSEWHRWAGVLALAIGVAVAWLVAVPVRARMQRNELLRPAAVLRERLRALSPRLLPLATMVPTLAARIRTISAELDPDALERAGYLPAGLPNPWTGSTADTEGYRTFLEAKSVQLACLALLVEAAVGLYALWLEAAPDRRPAIEEQLARLDTFAADDLTDLQALRARIRQVLEQDTETVRASGRAERPETYEEITVELRRLNWLVWLVYGLLTAAVGAYALVWTNPGFGVPTDYWECLFWGFGLPAATQLMQAMPATVATSLGVSLPK